MKPSNLKELEDLSAEAVLKFGQIQIVIAMEELGELIQQLSKFARFKENRDELIEEILDVEIMLEQVKFMAKKRFPEFEKNYNLMATKKIKHLEDILQKDYEKKEVF